MAPIKHGKLTTHVKTKHTCAQLTIHRTECGNGAWELCDKCQAPVCGMHTLSHYRAKHPRMI